MFRRRWAHYIWPGDADSAHNALPLASTITASYPLMMYVVNYVLPFFATASADATTYPDVVLCAFSMTQRAVAGAAGRSPTRCATRCRSCRRAGEIRSWPKPGRHVAERGHGQTDTLDLFLNVLAAARQPEAPTEGQIAELAGKATELLRLAAVSKSAHVGPVTLGEHWAFIRKIEPVVQRLREGEGSTPAESWYAWMI